VGLCDEDKTNWNKDILVSGRQKSITKIISSIPELYYFDVDKPFIIDKWRTWTLPGNVSLIKKYITNKPKILVLIRPIDEIVSSFIRIRKKNNYVEPLLYENILSGNDSTLGAIEGVLSAMENNNGEFLFVRYDDIVFETEKILETVYDFFELPKYQHDLQNISRPFEQNDELYGLVGLHDVRKTIEKHKYSIELPNEILKKCHYYNSQIFKES
jgi:hypothetical protein